MSKWTDETTGDDVIALLGDRIKGKNGSCLTSRFFSYPPKTKFADGPSTTVVITGPSQGGLGAAVALTLAKAEPAVLILLGRDQSKIAPVVEEIRSSSPSVGVVTGDLDLLDNATVEKAAALIKQEISKVDLLINNAGIMAPKDFSTSKDGVESQLAANHIGHFLLTSLILPELFAAGAQARIVNVSSQGYQLGEVRFDDYNFQVSWKLAILKSARINRRLLGRQGLQPLDRIWTVQDRRRSIYRGSRTKVQEPWPDSAGSSPWRLVLPW